MKEYKFRSECLTDFVNLLVRFNYKNHGVQCKYVVRSVEGFPDIEVELKVDLAKKMLMKIMGEVEDGHRMWQTLTTMDKYNGEILRWELT